MLTHKQILKDVWGTAHVGDMQYLRVYVSQVREKVEPDPANPVYIITEPGIGYRMETFAAGNAAAADMEKAAV
jgi:two-component system KDP operon response regulator KdpE